MTTPAGFDNKIGFVSKIADKLRGHVKPHQYGSVMLPTLVLFRFDAVTEATKRQVKAKAAGLGLMSAGADKILPKVARQPFGMNLNDADKVWFEQQKRALKDNEHARVVALNNDRDQYRVVLEKLAEDAIIKRHEPNGQLFSTFFEKPGFGRSCWNTWTSPTTTFAMRMPHEPFTMNSGGAEAPRLPKEPKPA